MKLFSNTTERRKLTDNADIYAIIKAAEHLEKAYARDAVPESRYERACLKLVSQFKTSEAALLQDRSIQNVERFMTEWKMDCPRAHDRLIRCGVPATVMHATDTSDADGAVRIAECVQHFITTMDALKLEQRAVDEIQPLIADLMSGLGRVSHVSCASGKQALEKWLIYLNSMRASAEIGCIELLAVGRHGQARLLRYDAGGKPA